MKLASFRLVVVFLMVLTLAACGGNDDGDSSQLASGLTFTTTSTSLTAGSNNYAVLEAKVVKSDGKPLANANVTFKSNIGTFEKNSTVTSKTVKTDVNGSVKLNFYPGSGSGTASISAFTGGYNQAVTITISPGTPDVAKSSITANPSALPADGTSTSAVTVVLLDSNGNLVADNTEVTLQATAGTITSTNPVKTKLGRAEFTYQAPSNPGTITLSTVEYPSLTASLVVGSTSSTDAANMEFSVANTHIFVSGVGKQDTTSIAITVKTASGERIGDANSGVDNLKIKFKSRPNGGEKIIGTNAAGNVVDTDATGEIAIRSSSGVATVTLQAGALPGVVEMEVEALKADGTSYSPAVKSVISQVSISSGPPHSITLSWPIIGGVTDMGSGIYRRNGSIFVTDQYGNAVPDGTVINVGVLDSVIASNNPATGFKVNVTTADGNASVSQNSAVVTDNTNTGLNLGTVSITRNDTLRQIQSNDRLLLLNAASEDKSRFVSSWSANTVTAQKNYKNSLNNLTYIIGTSALGAQIFGHDEIQDKVVKGQAVTKDGTARVYLQYPADNEHILTGCYDDPTTDTRATAAPAGSAQVWVVAESSETGATTVDNRACFSAMPDWNLTNDSGVTSISTSSTIAVSVTDKNHIPLPFVSLGVSVSYEVNAGGLSVTVGNCLGRSDKRTSKGGSCSLPITVANGASGDTATVSIGTGGNATPITISVSIP